MKKSDLNEINRLRRTEGLLPVEPATVVCLRCDNKFESWDKRNNRICDACKEEDDYGEHAEAYYLPDEILGRLKAHNIYDKMILALEYGYDAGLEYDQYGDARLIDTTLMDKDDW